MCLIHFIGGAFTRQPEELDRKLSAESSDLIKRAFENIDSQKLIDHHVHVAGLGVGGTFVNPKMRTWRHPFHRLKFKVYMSSAGAADFPGPSDPSLSASSGVVPGSGVRRAYQVYYRNTASAFCPPATFNVSNGWLLDW